MNNALKNNYQKLRFADAHSLSEFMMKNTQITPQELHAILSNLISKEAMRQLATETITGETND